MATSIFRMGSRSLEQDEDSISLGNMATRFLQRKQETQPSPPASPLLLQPPQLVSTGLVSTSLDDPSPSQPAPLILPSEIVTIPRNGIPAEYRMYGGFIRYLEGSDSAECIGLALYKKIIGTTTQVWISAGTVAGDLPSGFDPAEGKSIASGGSGNVWAEVDISGTTGDIVSVAVTSGGTTPNDSDRSFYYTLGNYSYTDGVPTITNYGCGSVTAAVCRNWFATSPPFYQVTFFR